MNRSEGLFHARWLRLAGLTVIATILSACAEAPVAPPGAAEARAELSRLQSDPQLATLAPVALRDAEAAVSSAEESGLEPEVGQHRVFMAKRKVEIARALAEARRAEDERQTLVAQRDQARLDSRTREAESAQGEATVARIEADTARMAAADAQQQAAELQRELEELRARPTDRGLVITLGDVLFETGKSELKPGAAVDLNRLVAFLGRYPDRTITIEGHTDNVGSESSNMSLSQRRADAVRAYLLGQGIDARRTTATGMGEGIPVAPNDNAGGRQQNRRVEIVVSNPPAAGRGP